jgi:hypothetical protein
VRPPLSNLIAQRFTLHFEANSSHVIAAVLTIAVCFYLGGVAVALGHQKQHYVPYYLSNLFLLSLKYAFGIISMFSTLIRCSIILSRLF